MDEIIRELERRIAGRRIFQKRDCMFPHIRLSKMVAHAFASIVFGRFGGKWRAALRRIGSMQMEIVDRLEARFSRARTEPEVRFYHGLSWTYSHVSQVLIAQEDVFFLQQNHGEQHHGPPARLRIAQMEDYIHRNFSEWSRYVIQGVYFDRYIEPFILEEERKVRVRQHAHRKARRADFSQGHGKVRFFGPPVFGARAEIPHAGEAAQSSMTVAAPRSVGRGRESAAFSA